MNRDWSSGDFLRSVFLRLDSKELASCMLVCRQWKDIALDDYFWKCLCIKRWPSICKSSLVPELTYHRLYKILSQPHRPQSLLPPRLSFEDLEFYIDIWCEDVSIFSEAVSGSVLRAGIRNPPSGIANGLRAHLESPMDAPDNKMMMSIEPRLTIQLGKTVYASVLVGRSDTKKMACIINQSVFHYVDGNSCRAMAYDYLIFSPLHPFVSGIRAWVSLLFMANNEEMIEVFGIELDFCDAAHSKNEVLWLLDMLDWK